ncbi:MAG TPA: dihydropteroate synthase [Solirubrobacteraceae bacterium]|nr:dihydropteroate synthase [Solirubrobacteraceae bacterium]
MSAYRLMGIVNVTPDSFSDGGCYLDADAAVSHGLELARQGAEILDVGGESTRPGAEPVALAEELRRVVPVIERLAASRGARSIAQVAQHPPFQVSIDTSKSAVAQAALAAGAGLVNDVTGLRGDPKMAEVITEAGCDCCLMHMRGEPRTMQRGAGGDWYEDVVSEVKAFLEERLAFAVAAGIDEQRILLDPGIGFGKTREHNLELLRRLDELVALGRPVLVGTSRKSFLGDAWLEGTIATNVLAFERGARVFRVHDVAAVAAALRVTAATLTGKWTASETTT